MQGSLLPGQLLPQLPTFVPVVRVTKVLPTWRTLKMVGALMSYQSLRKKGSVDKERRHQFGLSPEVGQRDSALPAYAPC